MENQFAKFQPLVNQMAKVYRLRRAYPVVNPLKKYPSEYQENKLWKMVGNYSAADLDEFASLFPKEIHEEFGPDLAPLCASNCIISIYGFKHAESAVKFFKKFGINL